MYQRQNSFRNLRKIDSLIILPLGTCRYGDSCTFAHGEHELKKSRSNEATSSGSYHNYQQEAYPQSQMYGSSVAAGSNSQTFSPISQ